jgi:hypothetical protein
MRGSPPWSNTSSDDAATALMHAPTGFSGAMMSSTFVVPHRSRETPVGETPDSGGDLPKILIFGVTNKQFGI